MEFKLPLLPPKTELETLKVFKHTVQSRQCAIVKVLSYCGACL